MLYTAADRSVTGNADNPIYLKREVFDKANVVNTLMLLM